jgi:hypothetical protein
MTAHKAILAAVLAGLSSLVAALVEANPVTFREWLLVVLSAVVAGLTVYAVPNRPRR